LGQGWAGIGRKRTQLAQVTPHSTNKRSPVKCRAAGRQQSAVSGQPRAFRCCVPFDCSLLTAHCSLLTAHCSLLTAHCSLLTAHYSLLTAAPAGKPSALRQAQGRRSAVSNQRIASGLRCRAPIRCVDKEVQPGYLTVVMCGATILIVAVRSGRGACRELTRGLSRRACGAQRACGPLRANQTG